jgi:hypothetical protein
MTQQDFNERANHILAFITGAVVMLAIDMAVTELLRYGQ